MSEIIEFPCGQCGQLLKVSAESVGRQARCPDCQHVQRVESGSIGAPETQSSSTPTTSTPTTATPTTATTDPADAAPEVVPSLVETSPSSFTASGNPGVNSASPQTDSPHVSNAAGQPVQPSARQAHEGTDTPTRRLYKKITEEISKIYVGQDELVLGTLVALFSSGHVLIESVPGLGKTLFVRTLGKVLGCSFGRIQFTADLMPSDITGAPIFDMKNQEFRFRPGPVFTQFLLADEINRSPAKTHAALLEIMQEYRVTVDGTSHPLERPFLVMATQNPVESEGTYNLPEAQLDRFMFKLVIDYPSADEESRILGLHSQQIDVGKHLDEKVEVVTNPDEIRRVTEESSSIRIDPKLVDYINKLVRLTREWPQFHMGASPRAGIALMQAARTLAAFQGRDFAVPDDVVRIAMPALRHRVILTAEAEVEGQSVDQLLTELIRSVEVPRL